MGRAPCCDKTKVKRGPWSPEEDNTLKNYVENYGTGGNWIALPQKAGLKRCGKSCRLRWLNYLRPNIRHGGFTEEEDSVILTLYQNIGSRWSVIASQLPGRTDNDVKNYWNTKLKKKLLAITTTTAATPAATSATIDNFNFAPSSSMSSMETIYSRNSNFVPYIPLMEVNSNQEMIAAADQIPLPELIEEPENGENNAYNSTGSLFPCAPLMPHEEALVSSFLPQHSLDNKLEDMTTFVAEWGSGLLPYDILNYLT